MFTLLKRDLRLFMREGSSALVSLMFFISLLMLLPFGLGVDVVLLQTIAPAMLWIGLLLSTLLGLESLFKQDKDDGSLEGLLLSETPPALIALSKALAHFVTHGLPLVIVAPILGLMLNLPFETGVKLMFSLGVGSLALTFIGVLNAALAVSLKKGGVLIAVLGLPFTFPILIFGVSALEREGAMLFLSGATLIIMVVAPLLSGLALRTAVE
jgi:heme exporter protein B